MADSPIQAPDDNHSSLATEVRELFEQYITESMDELPPEYIKNLNNVAILLEDAPTREQAFKLKLHPGSLLFGLYEGIPLTERGLGSTMALPDKITIFMKPILAITSNNKDLKQQVKRTLWHEIAHYYGLDHDRIYALEKGLKA